MSLPNSFAMLALSPSIRENAAFLFLQTGANNMIDMFIQSATGTPVNIMSINSGVSIPNTVYVNELGNDNTGQRGSATRPFATIEAALTAATIGDTIEVFPGTYSVTGNIINGLANYYFHKGSALDLQGNGRIEISEFYSVNIGGFLYLNNNGVAPYPIKILGNENNIEFELINCGTGAVLISGSNASAVFKGASIDRTEGSWFYASKIEVLDCPLTRFENTKFSVNYFNSNTQTIDEGLTIKNCVFDSTTAINQPCPYNFSGKFAIQDSKFESFSRFITSPSVFSEIKNTKFQGGIIVSGSNYFENATFDTVNFNYYPNFSLISNLGGHSVFTNCYARNFNNTSYLVNTYVKSGTASGASNFNIGNAFTSFKPTGAAVTVNYGSFIFNTAVK